MPKRSYSNATTTEPSKRNKKALTRAEFDAFVDKNIVIIQAPPMVLAAFEKLMAVKELFGHHVSKDRGTAQSTALDTFEADDDELAKYVSIVREWAASQVSTPFCCRSAHPS